MHFFHRISAQAGALCCFALSVGASAQQNFMTLPFSDPSVQMQNAPLYFTGDEHWGGGFAFDFIEGEIDASSTWQSFDVRASAAGVAIKSYQTGYGEFVLIRHDIADSQQRRYFTLYAHLDSVRDDIPIRSRHDTNFSQWKRVETGEYLGVAGQTGQVVCVASNCVHLHFEVFRGAYFANGIDPYDISIGDVRFGRDEYPPIAPNGCGSDNLWTECPPELAIPAAVDYDEDEDGDIELEETQIYLGVGQNTVSGTKSFNTQSDSLDFDGFVFFIPSGHALTKVRYEFSDASVVQVPDLTLAGSFIRIAGAGSSPDRCWLDLIDVLANASGASTYTDCDLPPFQSSIDFPFEDEEYRWSHSLIGFGVDGAAASWDYRITFTVE